MKNQYIPLLLILLMTSILIGAYNYDSSARALPVLVAVFTIMLLIVELMVQAKTHIGVRVKNFLETEDSEENQESISIGRALIYSVGWPGFLVALSAIIGILPAVLIYVFLSLNIVARKSIGRSLVVALAMTALSWFLFEFVMSYQLYRGILMNNLAW
tara:strand:+ start:3311 stop:3784 length:474 start_codon:yes stop_codon:yes gene_type:complete